MATKYAQHVSTKVTPQSQPIPGAPQVVNSAGGYTFQLDCWGRLERFLILGCEGNTYYASEQKLTVENAQGVLECARQDLPRTIQTIVQISDSGRAPKNDPAIFALGLLLGNNFVVPPEAMAKVCRIGTHLFQLAETVNQTRGWGRSMRKLFSHWYLSQKPDDLAYQVCKYQQRNGWSHRDVLRLCHAKTDNALLNSVLRYAVKDEYDLECAPRIIGAAKVAKTADASVTCQLIKDERLPRECVQTQHLNSPAVWEALLEQMPITAMLRNLGKMSQVGLLGPLSQAAQTIASRITDVERLKKGRVHPIQLLMALKVYQQGRGEKGKLTWTPVPQVVDALDEAFYLAFQAVEPTNKRWLVGLDVSGSMGCGQIAGCAGLTPCMGAAAMAMVLLQTEPQCYVHGFADTFRDLGMSKRDRLDMAMQRAQMHNFGRTDCAVPMLHALKHRIPVDCFLVITDNETWAGSIHPSQALQQYRSAMGINAKCIVMGMTATDFTIADPRDPGMLDVVGFDAACPTVMADFVR